MQGLAAQPGLAAPQNQTRPQIPAPGKANLDQNVAVSGPPPRAVAVDDLLQPSSRRAQESRLTNESDARYVKALDGEGHMHGGVTHAATGLLVRTSSSTRFEELVLLILLCQVKL
jgi:hypothetical protein